VLSLVVDAHCIHKRFLPFGWHDDMLSSNSPGCLFLNLVTFCYNIISSTCRPPSCELKQKPLDCIMVPGGARSKIGRWMQELGRLQAMRKPGSLTTSGLIISEIIKVRCFHAGFNILQVNRSSLLLHSRVSMTSPCIYALVF
jgi:hypothetical protein